MTKRDSQFAELPSPRTLNMESRGIEMPTAGPHSYPAPAIPVPDSHPQAASSTAPSSHTSPQIPPLHIPDGAFWSRPRQRVGHSILFKILEETLPSGRVSRQILVEETDAHGCTQPKSLEFFFNGIIGHLRDRWGHTLDYDRVCSHLANYWRSWFGAPTTGPVFEYSYPVPRTNTEQEQTTTSSPPTSGTVPETETQIPVQILQVAWFLNSIIEAHSEGNAAWVHEIRNTTPGTLRDLQADRVDHAALVNLSLNLGIMINRLVQQHDPNSLLQISEREEDHL